LPARLALINTPYRKSAKTYFSRGGAETQSTTHGKSPLGPSYTERVGVNGGAHWVVEDFNGRRHRYAIFLTSDPRSSLRLRVSEVCDYLRDNSFSVPVSRHNRKVF